MSGISLIPALDVLPAGHPAAIHDATGRIWSNSAYDARQNELDNNLHLSQTVARCLRTDHPPAEALEANLKGGGVLHASVQKQKGFAVLIGVIVQSRSISISKDIQETPAGLLLLEHDWEKTPLGHIDTWPYSLKTAASIMLAKASQASIFWGEERTILYNDAWKAGFASVRHQLMGKPGQIAFSEAWEKFSSHCDICFTGKSLTTEHELTFFDSVAVSGDESMKGQAVPSVIETYYTWSYTPIYTEAGTVGGVFNDCTDTTRTVVLERRLRIIRELAENTGPANTSQQFWQDVEKVLRPYSVDFPYVLCYQGVVLSSGSELERSFSKVGAITHMKLVAAIGIDSGDERASPSLVRLESGSADPWLFTSTWVDRKPTRCRNPCPEAFERRGWGDPVADAIVIPLGAADVSIVGMVVFGLNTRRPYDEAYRGFHSALAGNLGASLAATLSYEQEVQRADDMRSLDRAKTVFFQNVSHELRTPLTLIRGPSEDALNDTKLVDPIMKSRFKLIHRASGRLLRLVNSLMMFSSAEARRLQARFRLINLGMLTENLSSLFRSAVENAGLVFNVFCDDNMEDQVAYVDIGLWEQILFNLLSNAVKYTKKGSITVQLTYSASAAILRVQDTGCGIPENQLDRVLERFHRVEGAEARSHEGTGIGLALTNELVKIHGGFIRVQSVMGQGSTFTVSIPLGFSHLRPEDVDHEPIMPTLSPHSSEMIDEILSWTAGGISESESLASSSVDGSSPPDTSRHVVLLAEDNADARAYIKSILAPVFQDVIAVSDGQAALDFIRKEAIPDILLTDLMMPRLNGVELINALRNDPDPSIHNIPVIMITAGSGFEDNPEIELLKESIDFLTKPFTSVDLLNRVRTRLRGVKIKQDLQQEVRVQGVELTLTKRRYQRISELAPVAIFETDDADRSVITYANDSFFRLTGMSRSLPIQFDDLVAILTPASQTFLQQGWMSVITEGTPIRLDCAFVNGQNVFCVVTRLDDGSLLGTFTDQTDQRRFAAQQLSAARLRADEAIHQKRLQEAFIDIVSHELRNPLSAIVQSADLLSGAVEKLQEILSDFRVLVGSVEAESLYGTSLEEVKDANHAIASIALCARHQTIIASDILAVSRLDSNLLTLNISTFNLLHELKSTIDMYSVQAANQDVHLELTTGSEIDTDSWLMADSTRLSQILVNLMSNSCRILESWDGERRVTIAAHLLTKRPASLNPLSLNNQQDESRVWLDIEVSDSGPGIPLDDQARLFTQFNDIQPINARRSGGAGLGLYLCKKLAELQGGHIEHQSVPGKGAAFRFFIEARKASPTSAQRVTPNLNHLVRTSSPLARDATVAPSPQPVLSALRGETFPVSRANITILIVEDNIINQKLLERQLQKMGFRTAVANNGLEALQYLEACVELREPVYPSAVLMDMEMPILDGVNATMRIREWEADKRLPEPRMPIYAVTGNARQGQVDTALLSGMDRVYLKPYKISEIVKQLDLEARPRILVV